MTGPAPDPKRRSAERRGRRAEVLAALAVMLKGYRIRAWRYRCPMGEVDLIARKGDLVIFIEVKARRDLRAGIDAVTPSAARRINAAGEHWIARQPDAARLSWRTDVVVVSPRSWPKHLEGAV
jgi:putative endonuclease